MYTSFYGLREKPFALSPDPRFLFLAGSHREALAHVLYGIDQGEGFIAITGEVGTGKTTLSRTLLQRLGSDTEVAFIFNPMLTGDELLRTICTEFGLDVGGCSRPEMNTRLNEFLLDMKRSGRRVLLIIDEAQNMTNQTLEEVRLLSNLETATSKLIQILLFGQPELDEKLDSNELRQLRQRISVRWSLKPLTTAETKEYVRHRLRVAKGGDCDLFTDAALRELRRRARGVPRLVNLLADRSLLAGYAAGSRSIGSDLVDEAAREILGARRRAALRSFPWRTAYATAAVLGALAGGVLAWQLIRDEAAPTEVASTLNPPAVSAPPPELAAEEPTAELPADPAAEIDLEAIEEDGT